MDCPVLVVKVVIQVFSESMVVVALTVSRAERVIQAIWVVPERREEKGSLVLKVSPVQMVSKDLRVFPVISCLRLTLNCTAATKVPRATSGIQVCPAWMVSKVTQVEEVCLASTVLWEPRAMLVKPEMTVWMDCRDSQATPVAGDYRASRC